MAEKLQAKAFAKFLLERAAAHDGYIMGALGQSPKKLSDWYFNQYSGEQKKKALYWKEHAARVWDCQGMVEGYINDRLGMKINVRARDNYASWCAPKGVGKIPNQYKTPGASVFIHNGNYISHVGYLVEPVDKAKPGGDWWVVEARGVMYGVVRTKLSARGWNRWGLMTRHFKYDATPEAQDYELGGRVLKKGMKGADVKSLQEKLRELGYELPKFGADGEYGDETIRAVKAFQRAHGLDADGHFGQKSLTALMDALSEDAPDDDRPASSGEVEITGETVNLRMGPGTQFERVGIARKGNRLDKAEQNGWIPVILGGKVVWVSGKYAKVGG